MAIELLELREEYERLWASYGPSSEQGIEAFTNAIEQQHDQARRSAE